MPWNEFATMKVWAPDIENQRKIVRAYKVINDRIELKMRINHNLLGLWGNDMLPFR